MADNITDSISETFQNIFLAGVGALSLGGEKAKDVIDDLVARGQVTVEQGRKINEELKHKAAADAGRFREDAVRAYVKSLSPEERASFAQQMADIAREMSDAPVEGEVDDSEVVVDAEEIVDAEAADAEE